MKRLFSTFACVALMASTATPTFAASGNVHITNSMLKNGIFTNTENVGGGVWDYGTSISGTQKKCWSNYQHNSNTHSSTAQINTRSNRSEASAGSTSYASVLGPLDGVTHAYWNNEA